MKYLFVLMMFSLFSCVGNKIEKRLISKGSQPYPWKIWYVTENNFPAGTDYYYEVKYNNKDFMFSKDFFGTEYSIQNFIAASTFNTSDSNYGAVVLVFYKHIKDENGYVQWILSTALVRKLNDGNDNVFLVYSDGLEKHYELK